MKKYFKLMRVHHYIKNLLVFAALICSGQLLNGEKFWTGVVGFISFCMISSVVYIINDIRDREEDRYHPTKCNRPIAAGIISVKKAVLIAIILLVCALTCNLLILRITSTLLLVLYLIINLAYSMGLKNKPIIDITILAAGFFIRILYGAIITEITISNWLYLTVIVLAFYFSLGKRRNELKQMQSNRAVLKLYPIDFLDKNMGMCLTLGNVFYALWSVDEKTKSLYGNEYLVFTVPIVLLITMKYSMNIEGNADGDPVEVLLHDRILLLLCVVYLAIMLLVLYL